MREKIGQISVEGILAIQYFSKIAGGMKMRKILGRVLGYQYNVKGLVEYILILKLL